MVGDHPFSVHAYHKALEDIREQSIILDNFQRWLSECESIVSTESDESYMLKLKSDLEELNKRGGPTCLNN